MVKLWARMMRKERIVRSETIDMGEDLTETIEAMCARLDVPRPMWLSKHTREWAQFGQTAFTADHFVEPISFDRLVIEQFDSEAKKQKSQDPRNG